MIVLAHLLSAFGTLDWGEAELRRVLATSLRELSALCGPDELVTVCDSQQGCEALVAAGWPRPRRIAPVKDGNLGALFGDPSASRLREWAPEGVAGPWVLADLRNCRLTGETVRQAVELFAAHGGRTVVSCRPAQDHPFHLRMLSKPLGLLLVHRLASAQEAGAWLHRRGLEQEAALAETGAWVLSAPLHAGYSEEVGGLGCADVRWLPENSLAGRFFWKARPDDVPGAVGLSPWCGFADMARAVCRLSGTVLRMALPGLADGVVARPAFFDASGLLLGEEMPELMSVAGTVSMELSPDCTGVAVAVLRAGRTGEYTTERRYRPGRLWSGNVRLDDGAHICGRQSLPPVFEADYALVVGHTQSLERLDGDLAAGAVAAFATEAAALLTHPLDVLRMQVRRQDGRRMEGGGRV